jgi:hypothetical protein
MHAGIQPLLQRSPSDGVGEVMSFCCHRISCGVIDIEALRASPASTTVFDTEETERESRIPKGLNVNNRRRSLRKKEQSRKLNPEGVQQRGTIFSLRKVNNL